MPLGRVSPASPESSPGGQPAARHGGVQRPGGQRRHQRLGVRHRQHDRVRQQPPQHHQRGRRPPPVQLLGDRVDPPRGQRRAHPRHQQRRDHRAHRQHGVHHAHGHRVEREERHVVEAQPRRLPGRDEGAVPPVGDPVVPGGVPLQAQQIARVPPGVVRPERHHAPTPAPRAATNTVTAGHARRQAAATPRGTRRPRRRAGARGTRGVDGGAVTGSAVINGNRSSKGASHLIVGQSDYP